MVLNKKIIAKHYHWQTIYFHIKMGKHTETPPNENFLKDFTITKININMKQF